MRLPQSTDEFFDSYAGGFDAIYGEGSGIFKRVISKLFRRSMRERFELTVAGCNPVEGKTVLDIGCGPGHYGIVLAKRGARKVVGIDFAPEMLALSVQYAAGAGVSDRCEFIEADFTSFRPGERFDYSIVMGVMDYIEKQEEFVNHVLELTDEKAFFSFPSSQHWLSLQRKIRYRFKCDLYLYSKKRVEDIFNLSAPGKFTIDDLGRDYFVVVKLN